MKKIIAAISLTMLVILFFAGMISNILPSYLSFNNFDLVDKDSFDPVKQYELVRKAAGEGYRLEAMKLTYVKSDGLLHFNEGYAPEASYRFFKIAESSGKKNLPVGIKKEIRYRIAEVIVRKPLSFKVLTSGKSTRVLFSRGIKVMRHGITTDAVFNEIEAPSSSIKTMWDEIRRNTGIPENAVADVIYDGDYSFKINGEETTSYNFDSAGSAK